MIKFVHEGNFKKTFNFFKRSQKMDVIDLHKFGQLGVEALREATPVDSGLTAESWYYEISDDDGRLNIVWRNSNIQDGVPIAVILQYGHATGTGGWVEGRDYINPAIQPIFDAIAENAWKELTK